MLCAGIVLSMNTATMDGSRALYGISQDGMTIRWLGKLNRNNVPGNAMTLDAVLNLVLLFLAIGTLAGGGYLKILAVSNFGYVIAHIFAISGFLLLRKDRPGWPRPIRLGAIWTPIAFLCLALDIIYLVVGSISFSLTGYSGGTEVFIWSLVVLVIAIAALRLPRRSSRTRASSAGASTRRRRLRRTGLGRREELLTGRRGRQLRRPVRMQPRGRSQDHDHVRLRRDAQAAYGESYTCECGRSWSTEQIPAADYDAIRALDRRYRLYGWFAFGGFGHPLPRRRLHATGLAAVPDPRRDDDLVHALPADGAAPSLAGDQRAHAPLDAARRVARRELRRGPPARTRGARPTSGERRVERDLDVALQRARDGAAGLGGLGQTRRSRRRRCRRPSRAP